MAEDNADSQTDKVNEASEGVQVNNRAETTDKGTSERFSINKVQVKSGKNYSNRNDDLDSNYLSKLPVLESKAAAYVPMPYVFRVPSYCAPIKIKNLLARSPPFHLLLDHTIAVIWLLFAAKEYENCPLGIVQLQWALAFLKTIHTRQGVYPEDVEVCIDAIEELLINQYAQLSKEMGAINRLDETVHYADGAFRSTTMVTQNIPFSINYFEMMKRAPETQHSKDHAHHTISMTSTEAEQELENIKKAAGVESIEKLGKKGFIRKRRGEMKDMEKYQDVVKRLLHRIRERKRKMSDSDSISRDKAINVLKLWKTDQVEKIRDELRRLRSIEEKMKDIDDNFQGYIEDDLDVLYTT